MPCTLSAAQVTISASIGDGVRRTGQSRSRPAAAHGRRGNVPGQAKGAYHQIIDLRSDYLDEHHRRPAQRTQQGHGAGGAPSRLPAHHPHRRPKHRVCGGAPPLGPSFSGPVMPTTAIPSGRRSGLAGEIAGGCCGAACIDRKRWRRAPRRDRADVRQHVRPPDHGPDFVSMVAGILADTDTDPGLITIEITEGALISDAHRALIVLLEPEEARTTPGPG